MSLQNTKQEQRNFEELISNFHHPLMRNELEIKDLTTRLRIDRFISIFSHLQ